MAIRKTAHAMWIGTVALMTVLLSAALPAEAMSYSVIYRFQGGPTDGSAPWSTLLNLGGTFYGTTSYGGGTGCDGSGCGSVFKLKP